MASNTPRWSADDESDTIRHRGLPIWVLTTGGLLGSLVIFCVAGIFLDPPQVDSENSQETQTEWLLVDAAESRPKVVHSDGYVGSQACQTCHEEEHASWSDSYHRTMTQVASASSIVGNFDKAEMEFDGIRYRFGHDGDEYWIEFDNPQSGPQSGQDSQRNEPIHRRILLCTGSHHRQIY